jgi:hypothetical protein
LGGGEDREADTIAFLDSGRVTGKPKEVSGSTVTCAPGPRTVKREEVPGKSLPKLRRKWKACKPQKGMFRLRERNTASGGKDAGAYPGRDSHQPEGLSQGPREAKGSKAQGRRHHARCHPGCWQRP